MHSGWFRWLFGGMLVGSSLLLGVSQALAHGGPSGGLGGYGGGMMQGGAGATTSGVPPGCGRGPGGQNVQASAIAELPSILIGIYDDRFQPVQISVQPGTLVIWRNFG